MAKKAHPELVNKGLAIQALRLAKNDRQAVYSRYITVYFRHTGKLAPGCDNRDLQAWIDNYLKEQAEESNDVVS